MEVNLFPHHIAVLVISSNLLRNVFSAGYDLNEVHAPSTTEEHFTVLWVISVMFLSRLYKSPLCTAAAIRDAIPGGGYIISLCCDYRIATKNAIVGLNEIAIGLAVLKFWTQLFVSTVFNRVRAEELLASGHIVSGEEAQRLGLVNRAVREGGRAELESPALDLATT